MPLWGPLRSASLRSPHSAAPKGACSARLKPFTEQKLHPLANFNVVAVILSALVGFAERNTTGNSNEATLILVGTLLAFPCWILTCYYVYVLMRAMKSGRLGASICVLVVAFIPFVTIVTTISIYFMAKKELVNAGVKIGSASFMKNQIQRMKQ
jgi:hypothetical protein